MLADPPPPGFYGPEPYADRWLLIGLALVVLIALWYVALWWWTRKRPPLLPATPAPDRLTGLRAEYARQIDLVLSRARSGRITQRQGHQQLSVLLRHFVEEVSGIAAPTMTLTELHRSHEHVRLTPVSQVVATLYPGEFGPLEAETLAGAAHVAKQVVARWT